MGEAPQGLRPLSINGGLSAPHIYRGLEMKQISSPYRKKLFTDPKNLHKPDITGENFLMDSM